MSGTRRIAGTPRPLPSRPETIRTRANPAPPSSLGRARVFIQGLDVMASIGVHPHEHDREQRIIVDVTLDLGELPPPRNDRLGETVDYQAVARQVEAFARDGHVQLVETLAERIAAWCLEDPRVIAATVRVAKPEALENAFAAGCEITRSRSSE